MASPSSVVSLLKKISYYLISQHNCLKENNIKISRSMDQAISDLVSELNVITVESNTYLSDDTPKPAKFTPSLKYGPKSKRRKFFEEIHDYTDNAIIVRKQDAVKIALQEHSEDLLETEDNSDLLQDEVEQATLNITDSNNTTDEIPEDLLDLIEDKSQYEEYKCNGCSRKFKTQGLLREHSAKHVNERPYQCHYCPNNYKSKETLDSHIRSHTGETPYECKFCDRKFAWRTSAYRHMKEEHGTSKVKKYKCPADGCDDAYYTTLELKKHITIHVGCDGFACHFCLELFDKYKELQQHLLTHVTKPVTCDVCGLGVCSNTSLRRHMLTHTGEKPHKCPVCDVGFPVRSSLKHHMLTHTGEKPHKCEFCPAQFTQSGNLTIHAKRCARRQQAKMGEDYQEQDDDEEEEEMEEAQVEEEETQSDTIVYYEEDV